MPVYKTVREYKPTNIKQINTVLSLPRTKERLTYTKDKKIKSELEYPLSNDGIMYINNDQQIIYISVHLSNTEAKLVWQLENLVTIVNQYRDYIIHILGDFNVVPMKYDYVDNILYFLKKNEKLKSLNDTKKIEVLQYNSRDIMCEFLYHTILFKDTDYNTTCKVRVITAQFDKMFEVASDKIDTSFILFPNNRKLPEYNICHSLHYFTNNTEYVEETPYESETIETEKPKTIETKNPETKETIKHKTIYEPKIIRTKIIENTVDENTLYPVEWLSDHSLLKSTITIGDNTITTITLNISGESQTTVKAYNWAEFAVKYFYDVITSNKSLSQVKNEMFTSSEIFGDPVFIDNVQVNNLKELVKADKKYFCETFKNKSLRDCVAVDYHRNPSDTTDVIQYYQELSKTLNIDLLKYGLIDDNYNKFRKLQDIFSRIMNFTFKNNNDEDVCLSSIFNYWYNLSENVNKIKILDVLEYYLDRDVDVIALQEVSIVGGSKISILYFIQNLIITKYDNYVLVKPVYDYRKDKTVGLLIMKKSLTSII